MCGRTALTLNREQILKKCIFKKSSNGNKSNTRKNSNENQDNESQQQIGSDSEASVVPVWRAAPGASGSWSPSPNIAPSLHTPVLRLAPETQTLSLEPMMWGLVPPWHPGPGPTSHGLSTNNCRVEGVRTSKLYSPCLSLRRCVVVCEGFYEWCRWLK